jgi:hypothetical protein
MAEIPDLGVPPIFRRTLEYLGALDGDAFEALIGVLESL